MDTYCITLIVKHILEHKIKDKIFLDYFMQIAILSAVFFPLIIIFDMVGSTLSVLNGSKKNSQIFVSFFYLGLSVIHIVFIKRKAFQPADLSSPVQIPEGFSKLYNLTEKETEILGYLVRGFGYGDIGRRMSVKISTVKTRIIRIYQKTTVSNRMEILHKIKEFGGTGSR